MNLTVIALHQLLGEIMEGKTLPEIEKLRIRIGDQLEAGPYEHTGVGGVFKGNHGDVIFCAADEVPEQEGQVIDEDMPVLWKPE